MVSVMNLFSKVSTFLSVGCAIHCIILPIMIALIPIIGEFSHHWWHTYLEPWEVPTLIMVVFLTSRQVFKNWSPKKKFSLILLSIGTLLVAIGNQAFNPHSFFHPFFTIIGITHLLIAQFKAHKLNHIIACQHGVH